MIRTESGCSVSRFAEVVGVPRAPTTGAWRAAVPAIPPRGHGRRRWWTASNRRWRKYAAQWPAWGYRKIGAIAAADGHHVGSPSSVKRAMARRNLL